MKHFLITISLLTISSGVFANCSDQICNVKINYQTVYFDVGSCSFGTQPIVTLTDANGNLTQNADGKTTTLPSQINSSTTNETDVNYILAGFWNTATTSQLKFVDGDGAEVFNLDLIRSAQGAVGTLTSTVPGLEAQSAIVNCPNN